MKTITHKMSYERSTKGTHLYKNFAGGIPVNTLYIRQDAFRDLEGRVIEPPQEITVTVTAE